MGTGIWLDNTGIYGLLANVQEFYISAADGKGYFGAGNVVLDATGIAISSGASLAIASTTTATTGHDAVSATQTVENASLSTSIYVGIKGTVLKDAGAGNVLYLKGINGVASATGGNVVSGDGVHGEVGASGTGAYGTGVGVRGSVSVATGTHTSLYGGNFVAAIGGGTVTNAVGVYGQASGASNNYNLYLGTLAASANNWSLYSIAAAQSAIAGNLRIGSTTAPTVALDVTGAALISSTLGVTGVISQGGTAVSLAGHGAADHANVARNCWPTLIMTDATIAAGQKTIDFADAVTKTVQYQGKVPADWVAGATYLCYLWHADTATTGNVRWSLSVFSRQVNGGLVTNLSAATTRATNGVATAGTLTRVALTTDFAGTDLQSESFQIEIQRLGGDAADTMTDTAKLDAVWIEYAATG